MPAEQRKTASTNSVTNNIPVPMRKAILRNCTSPPKAMTVRKTGNIMKEHRFLDGIMRKAHRKHPLTEAQTKRNRYLSKTRYVVEQSFGTLHRKFRYARATYFGLCKVSVQSHLKAMCLNLLKAANRLSVPVAA